MVRDVDDEELMRRYLLHAATAEERREVARRIAESDAFFESLSALEEQLIVQHLQGRLPAEWRDGFRAAFLDTGEGRRQVEEMRAFHEAMAPVPRSIDRTEPLPFRSVVRTPRRRRFLVPAAAAAAVATLAVGGLLFFARGEPGTTGSGETSVTPGTTAIFVLAPGLTRSRELTRSDVPGANVFRIAPDARQVRLELSVPADDVADVQLTLRIVGGTTLSIASAPDVRRSGANIEIAWLIPVELLPPGDYLLTATAAIAGTRETIATRFFSVVL